MANPRNGLPLGNLAMTCLADAALGRWLAEFKLNIINAFQLQQPLLGCADDLIALALCEARQVESDHSSRGCHPDLIKPAQFQQ